MRVQLAFPVFRAFDSSGDPLAGGKLYTYDTGTTTPRATYDNNGSANTNPVILDANGEAEVWLDNGLYRLVLHDSDDVLQWTIDSVTGIVAPASAAATKTGTDDTLAITPAGLTLEVIDDRGYGADAEADDDYTITLSPAPAAYYTGMTIRFDANTVNTGACTLDVNSLGAKAIKKAYDQDLEDGDISAGQIVTVTYDGTNFQMTSFPTATVDDTAYNPTTWDAITTSAPSKNAVRDALQAGLRDIDGDTLFQLEESADEDTARIDVGGTEAFILDANGLRLPIQPAFLVDLNAQQANIATGSEIDVTFDTEVFDIGGNFDTGTYTFTAPVTGKYQLNVTLYLISVDSAATALHVRLLTSNRNYYAVLQPNVYSADFSETVHLSVLADMDAADTAKVAIYITGGAAQTDIDQTYSYFSGYLVA